MNRWDRWSFVIDLISAVATLVVAILLVTIQIVKKEPFLTLEMFKNYFYFALIIIPLLYLIVKIFLVKDQARIVVLVSIIIMGLLLVVAFIYHNDNTVLGDVSTAAAAMLVFLSNAFFFPTKFLTPREKAFRYLAENLRHTCKPEKFSEKSRKNEKYGYRFQVCYTKIQSDTNFTLNEKEDFRELFENNHSFFIMQDWWKHNNARKHYVSFYHALDSFIYSEEYRMNIQQKDISHDK